MDWIRRNWPDLIIGLALLAVIAGIIATLLSGGSFLPGSATTSTAAPSATTSSSAGSAQSPSVATDQPGDSVVALPTDGETAVAGADTSSADTSNATDAATDSADVASQTTQVDVTPIVPTGAETTQTAESTPSVIPVATDEGTASAGTAETSTPISLGTASSDLPYRVSVGSYRDAANAERRAESFSAAGYPTFIGTQDDLSIVLVGPYGTRAEAETAVAAIQRDGLEAAPLLFEFSEETDQGSIVSVASGAEAGAAAATAASADAGESAAAPSTPLTTTEGGSFLQAGAYNDSESAQPQRERLEDLGLNVSEVREGSFVKLLAGPFAGAELSAAQATLDAQGIDYFVRGN